MKQANKSWFECRALSDVSGEVLIYDDIGSYGIDTAKFNDALRGLGPVKDITLRINSGGGNVFDGQSIYNLLKQHPAHVTVRVDGLAASSASLIAMAGDRVEMPEASWMMIHDPVTVWSENARAEDHEFMADRLRGIKQTFVGVYARRTGISVEKISEMMSANSGQGTWMDGPAAVELGFADEVIDAVPIAASADLSRYGDSVPAEVRRLVGRGSAAPQSTALRGDPVMAVENDTAAAAEVQPKDVGSKSRKNKEIVDSLVGSDPAFAEMKDQKPGGWMTNGRETDEPKRKGDTVLDIEARAAEIAQRKIDAINGAYKAGRNLGLERECQELIDRGVEASDIPEILIEVHARKAARTGAVQSVVAQAAGSASGVRVGFSHDDPTVVMHRMADAIAAHYAPSLKVPDASRQYMAWRPGDMMRDLLERRGVDTRALTRSEIVDAALHTTSDFPELLGTSANKIFLASYDAAPATFRSVMGRVDLANFQSHNLLRDGDFPTLNEVLESGEFTYGTISESKETAQLKTYGRTFGITRQSLVNDTLGVFGRMVAKIGQAVARFENKTAWAVVTANGNMSDGVALFHANHGNLTGTGTAISATSLGVARALMRVQKSLDGETLNIAPRTLVVPAAKETIAEQTLSPLVVPEAPSNLTPSSLRQLAIVAEPLLDANSTTAWYLFADPMQGSSVVYGYLEGEAAPRVRTNDPFNVDGIEFQVRMDFHVAKADYRFAYKNVGA